MKYRKLGTTDLEVSVICLGTMTFGEQNSSEEAFALIEQNSGNMIMNIQRGNREHAVAVLVVELASNLRLLAAPHEQRAEGGAREPGEPFGGGVVLLVCGANHVVVPKRSQSEAEHADGVVPEKDPVEGDAAAEHPGGAIEAHVQRQLIAGDVVERLLRAHALRGEVLVWGLVDTDRDLGVPVGGSARAVGPTLRRDVLFLRAASRLGLARGLEHDARDETALLGRHVVADGMFDTANRRLDDDGGCVLHRAPRALLAPGPEGGAVGAQGELTVHLLAVLHPVLGGVHERAQRRGERREVHRQ